MIETTWNCLLLGRQKFNGYGVYVISDSAGRIAYVGMSKDIKNRLTKHLHEKREVADLLQAGQDLPVFVYSLDDVAADFVSLVTSEPDSIPEGFHWPKKWEQSITTRDLYVGCESERSKAERAEFFLITMKQPYLNDRKAWSSHPHRVAPYTARYLEALSRNAQKNGEGE